MSERIEIYDTTLRDGAQGGSRPSQSNTSATLLSHEISLHWYNNLEVVVLVSALL
jgi:hypothetical protein